VVARVTEDPTVTPTETTGLRSNLAMRVVAALILAPLTLAAVYFGGKVWLILVALTAIGLYAEWLMLVGASRWPVIGVGIFAQIMIAASLALHDIGAAFVCIASGMLAVAALAGAAVRLWGGLAVFYCGAALVAAVTVRQDPEMGLPALLYVLLIVWATDIMGYFAGRSFGGPKLWVRVSPKKTWAGAIGSLIGSFIVAGVFASLDHGRLWPLLALGGLLSMVSQIGDLFESAIKRQFGVKDSSQIIPGHGGLLDRLDGFVFAIVVAALIGGFRGGVDGIGRGLLVW
jgi:phosphatidate cytidylyltransferase